MNSTKRKIQWIFFYSVVCVHSACGKIVYLLYEGSSWMCVLCALCDWLVNGLCSVTTGRRALDECWRLSNFWIHIHTCTHSTQTSKVKEANQIRTIKLRSVDLCIFVNKKQYTLRLPYYFVLFVSFVSFVRLVGRSHGRLYTNSRVKQSECTHRHTELWYTLCVFFIVFFVQSWIRGICQLVVKQPANFEDKV